MLCSIMLLCFCTLGCNAQYNVDKLLLSGRIALHYEDYVLSIQYFNQAINQKPYLWEPWQLRAISKFYLEDWQGVVNDASKAIELNPYIVSLYDLRGLAFIRQQKYEKAIDDYSKAITIEPANKNVWYNKSICLLEQKEYDKLLQLLDTITSRWSNYAPPFLIKAEAYLHKKDTLKAVESVSEALTIDKHNGDAWRMKAYLLFAQEKWKDADEAFSNALQYKPKDVGCYINRAISRLKLNNYRGAMSDYDMAIDIAPNNFLAHYNRGLLRVQVGDDNRAIEDFDFVLSLEPYNIMALFNRATLLDRTGDLRGAIRDYTLVIDKFPDFWTGLQYRAACYRKLGMIAKAEKDEFKIFSAQMNKHLGYQKRWSRKKLSEMRKLNDIDPEKYNQLVVDDSPITEHEYKSVYRGKVQNRQTDIQYQPYIALTIETKQIEFGRYTPFDINIEKYLNRIKERIGTATLNGLRLGGQGEGTGTETFHLIDSLTTLIPYAKDDAEKRDLLLLRSIAYSSAQNMQDAMRDIDEVLLTDGNNIVALWQKAVCLSMMAEYEQNSKSPKEIVLLSSGISREYEHLRSLSSANALVYYNEGTYYARKGEYAKSVECLSEAIRIDERLPYAYYNRGLAYLHEGMTENARMDLGKAGEYGLYSAYSIMKNNLK